MVSNETRLETLKKQIAKRETLIKSESEKLKNDKKKLEGISFDENFKKQLSLAKKIMASKTTEQDIADFFALSEDAVSAETKESTMKTEGNHHV